MRTLLFSYKPKLFNLSDGGLEALPIRISYQALHSLEEMGKLPSTVEPLLFTLASNAAVYSQIHEMRE